MRFRKFASDAARMGFDAQTILRTATKDAFNEADHPREGGKFASGGGGDEPTRRYTPNIPTRPDLPDHANINWAERNKAFLKKEADQHKAMRAEQRKKGLEVGRYKGDRPRRGKFLKD